MNRRHFMTFIGLLPWLAPGASAAGQPLRAHHAEFRLRLSGLPVGRMERELRRQSERHWIYHSLARTTGVAAAFRDDRIMERVMLEQQGGQLRPLSYTMQQTGRRERREQLRFNWAESVVQSTEHGWRIEDVPAGLLDELGAQVVLITDLQNGQRGELSYQVADDGEIKTYRFQVGEAPESVDTGLGRYESLKVERIREDSDRQTAFWSAPELDYWPVKVEQHEGGARAVMTLESLEFTD